VRNYGVYRKILCKLWSHQGRKGTGIDILIDKAARELGISTLELSKRPVISQPTASRSVKRGEKIVKEKELKLMGCIMPIYQCPSPSSPQKAYLGERL
jgi:hypothetical protein